MMGVGVYLCIGLFLIHEYTTKLLHQQFVNIAHQKSSHLSLKKRKCYGATH